MRNLAGRMAGATGEIFFPTNSEWIAYIVGGLTDLKKKNVKKLFILPINLRLELDFSAQAADSEEWREKWKN